MKHTKPTSTTTNRRAPYSGIGRLPKDIANNGYVVDLVAAITNAADSLGQSIHYFQKNGDWYIAVLIPNVAELAKIDAESASEAL
jgi:hypothetical protein